MKRKPKKNSRPLTRVCRTQYLVKNLPSSDRAYGTDGSYVLRSPALNDYFGAAVATKDPFEVVQAIANIAWARGMHDLYRYMHYAGHHTVLAVERAARLLGYELRFDFPDVPASEILSLIAKSRRTQTVGQMLCQARMESGMTQAMLGRAAGVSRTMVYAYEKGRKKLPRERAILFARALKREEHTFMDINEQPPLEPGVCGTYHWFKKPRLPA